MGVVMEKFHPTAHNILRSIKKVAAAPWMLVHCSTLLWVFNSALDWIHFWQKILRVPSILLTLPNTFVSWCNQRFVHFYNKWVAVDFFQLDALNPRPNCMKIISTVIFLRLTCSRSLFLFFFLRFYFSIKNQPNLYKRDAKFICLSNETGLSSQTLDFADGIWARKL